MTPNRYIPDHIPTILIVDDERQNRRLFEIMLKPEGYQLLTAATGEEALTIVSKQPPDLILLDIMMPGMDGYQVVAELKGHIATQNIPIIMITALDDRKARMRALLAGAEEFLSKPVDRAELCVRIKNLLRLKAYSDYHDKYSHMLEGEVGSRMAELLFERDKAQQYLDTAESILLALDLDGRITLVNRYACTLLGWPCDELIGRDWNSTCIPQRKQSVLKSSFHAQIKGEYPLFENLILTKSGGERMIEWRNTLLRNESGEIIGLLCAGVDITERLRALQALRIAEERMRFALKSANVGIWDLDHTTGVLEWSEVLEFQYGLQPGTFGGTFEEFIGRVHVEDRQTLLDLIEKNTKAGTDFSATHRTVHPDGTVRWLSSAGRVFLDERDKPIRAIGISQDVTERHVLEQQYYQAQKLEAIGLLAAGVAHDFNNILSIIIGQSELLLGKLSPEDSAHRRVEEIHKAGFRASLLTRQLLIFSRKQKMEMWPLDLNHVVMESKKLLERLIGEHITITFKLHSAPLQIKADPGQIEQVIMNLAINARDAMSDGGEIAIVTSEIELDVGDLTGMPAGKYAKLIVCDTGEGMSAEVASHIFEPFFTTKKDFGTGLGLATVYGIVKEHHGTIEVQSQPGIGTSFIMHWPIIRASVAQESPTSGKKEWVTGTETVLLVEDEPAFRNLIAEVLENRGYKVLCAEKGAAALEIAGSFDKTIHLLITDVIMPGMNGAVLAEKLKQNRPDTRILFISGYTDDILVKHGSLMAGMPMMMKPFSPSDLARKVREVLDAKDPLTLAS